MGKIICIQTWNRPGYLRKTLDALSKCLEIENYTLLVSAEPGCQEVLNMIKNIKFMKVDLHINSKCLGLCDNTKASVTRGFSRSDHVIVIEDDIILGKDALRYLEWGLETYKSDKHIWSIGCDNLYRSKSKAIAAGNKLRDDVFFRRKHFSCWGWAMWQDRFQKLIKQWPSKKPSWAIYSNQARRSYDMFEIYPEVSRSIQIGETGVHMKNRKWFKEYIKGETFIHDRIPDTYKEMKK